MRRLLLLLLAIAPTAWADFGDYEKHAVLGQSLLVETSMGAVRITAVDDSAFYVHYVEDDIRQLPSFALKGIPEPVSTVLQESDDRLEFAIDGLTAIVSKSQVRIAFEQDGQPLVAEEHGYFALETLRGFRFSLDDDEKLLGGGQRVLGMDRRGHRMPLYNRAHYGYTTESNQMYYGLPAVLSSDRYILVFDNSATGHLDIGKTEPDVLQFEAVSGRTAYLVVAGNTYPELINNYTDVTGKQPLPPRWAFGNFASRFGYRTESETRDVVRRFRRQKIPLDAVILDLYWFGPEIQGFMGNLDWDRDAWPTPEDMIRDFADDGVQTITITEPFVLRDSSNWDDAVENEVLAKSVTGGPRRFDFYFGNTGLIDVFNADARDWFARFYNRLYGQGIGGNWGDLGEPEVHPSDAVHFLSDINQTATADEIHNAYGHRWAQMVYENQIENQPNIRPVVMMRSGFAGTQRYGMIPWTGDVSRSWDGLKPQVELSLQMGLLGLGYTHSDLGGFAGGEVFDKEMYIRWLQYGVFQPVYRPHAQEHIPSEAIFHDRETRDIVRDAVELRYRMLPYNYTLAWENSTSGMPLMRPVFFEDESRPNLIDIKDTYFWGDAFLVKPVTEPGQTSVPVDLPAGTWFNFWSGERVDGGQTVDTAIDLETIPVYVRAGAFVPTVPLVQTTRDYTSEELTLHYYADASVSAASGHMYDDDGATRQNLERGDYEVLHFDAQHADGQLVVTLSSEGSYTGKPETRTITLVVHNWGQAASDVRQDDRPIRINRRMPRRGSAAAWDAENRSLTLRFDWDHSTTTLNIQ
ncbi:MAG: TIM-barrel domain-containing protein [Pseudomonadota bacterium]